MKNQDEVGSLEAVVPADERGSSCLPVVAQAAVPAESGDLRGRIEQWEDFLRSVNSRLRALRADQRGAERLLRDLKREYEATKTPVGGNEKLSHGAD